MRHSILFFIKSVCVMVCMIVTVSCNDFLDTLPDNRAELDSKEKIADLLVYAYPNAHHAMVTEMYSDNADDNGVSLNVYSKLQDEAFHWEDITDKRSDSPYAIWTACYKAIAACNQALLAIEKMGNTPELLPYKGEALICRAYNHFILVNVFSKAYNAKTSGQDLGIHYMTDVEEQVFKNYDRGTVEEDYQKMEKDILEALPLIDEHVYKVPKYHFNKKAALAFAARFYLYYMKEDKSNLDKVISYATQMLTDNPSGSLRDWRKVGVLSSNNSIRANAFINAEDRANLLIISTYSGWPSVYGPYLDGERYSHNTTIADYETCNAPALWGRPLNLCFDIPVLDQTIKVSMHKIPRSEEMVDVVKQIMYPHAMFPVFTSDETILCRAEAYALKADYEKAIADLQTFISAYTYSQVPITEKLINNLFGEYDAQNDTGMKYYTPQAPTPKKRLHPAFTVEPGFQEAIIQAILHSRRVLTLHEGLRWFDIKRYGIEIYRRKVYNGIITVTDTMPIDDERRAIQLPAEVIYAGMTPNPRPTH